MALQFVHYLLFALFPAAVAYAAVSDLLTLTIPNRLVLAIAVLFIVLAPIAGVGWADFGMHIVAGGVVLFWTIVLGYSARSAASGSTRVARLAGK